MTDRADAGRGAIDWTAYAKRARRPLSERGTVDKLWLDAWGKQRVTTHSAELATDLALAPVEFQFSHLGEWQIVHRATCLKMVQCDHKGKLRALLLALQEAPINWPGWSPVRPPSEQDAERARSVILSWREWAEMEGTA